MNREMRILRNKCVHEYEENMKDHVASKRQEFKDYFGECILNGKYYIRETEFFKLLDEKYKDNLGAQHEVTKLLEVEFGLISQYKRQNQDIGYYVYQCR